MNKPIRKPLFASAQSAQHQIYLSPAWKQHFQIVMHLTGLHQNVLLIIAPFEGGKSTFLEHILKEETKGLQKVSLTAKHSSVEELLKQIALSFGFIWESASATQEALHHLQDKNDAQGVCTLFVDDAHLLTDEQLQAVVALINTQAPASSQLRLVFLGEPSLELRLFSPEFTAISNSKIYTIELESWTLQDVNAYLNMSCSELQLTKDQIATLFEQSAGLPGLVVKGKKSALQNGTSTGKNMANKSFSLLKFHPISLGILAGLAVGGSYLVYNNMTSDEAATLAPINAAQTQDNNWSADNSPKDAAPTVAFHFDKMDTSDVIEDDMRQEHEHEQIPTAKSASPIKDAPVAARAPSHDLAPKAKQEVVALNEENKNVKTQAVEPAKEVKKATTATENKKTSQTSIKVSGKSLTPQENYLMSIDKKNYTLQLLGSSSEQSIKQFIKKHELENNTYSFQTKRQGKDWYIVVYGNYQTADEAKLASQNIADSLKSSQIQPWVRNLGAIHKDIQQQG